MVNKTMKKIIGASLIVSIIILGIVLLSVQINNSTQDSNSRLIPRTAYTPAIALEEKVAPDFTLVDQDGQEFTFSETSDKISLIYFGYTNCPDVCPLVLFNFAAVARALGQNSDTNDYNRPSKRYQ